MAATERQWTEADRDAIFKHLQSIPKLKKIRLSIFYRLGLLLVSVTMIILPLIYLAFVAAVGYGVFYHAVYNASIFQSVRSVKAAVVIYLLPLILGGGLFLFLIKPLFAKKAKMPVFYKVKDDIEPFLYCFVDEIARIVGSPTPREIQLNTDVNASAGFRRGMFSFIFSDDLVLTIGLPLIEGMSLQQLTGVIAHEFGHFSQGSAMRLTYVIRTINGWLTRVVYERDSWDEHLYYMSQSDDGREAILALLLRLFIWIARRILWVLAFIGNAISSFMLRQMEYDADHCEILLEGSENFKTSSEQLVLLSIVHQVSLRDIFNTWQQEGKLVDNWGELNRSNLETMPKDDKADIIKQVNTIPTGLFDSHPSTAARIQAAQKLNKPCLFESNYHCGILFNNIKAVATGLTLDFYHEYIDSEIEMKHLVSSSEVIEKKEEANKYIEAVARYFQYALPSYRSIPLPEGFTDNIPDYEKLFETIKASRDYILTNIGNYKKYMDLYDSKHKELVTLKSAKSQLEIGLQVTHDIGLESNNLQSVRVGINSAKQDKEEIDGKLLDFESQCLRRLLASLQLLFSEQIELDEAFLPMRDEITQLLPAYRFLSDNIEHINDFSHDFFATFALPEQMGSSPEEETVHKFWNLYDKTRDSLRKFLETAGHLKYPFEHMDETLTIETYLVKEIPERNNVEANYYCFDCFFSDFYGLYYRILARFITIAETMEHSLGFDSFEQPPEEKEEEKAA